MAKQRGRTHARSPVGDDDDPRCVIGIRIIGDAPDNQPRLVGVVTNMLAEVIAGPHVEPLLNLTRANVVAKIEGLVSALKREIGESDLVGVGLEMGGHIHNGRIVHSANTHWDNFPLAEILAPRLNLRVTLENDANALAVYESKFEGEDCDDFVILMLTDHGVGCSLVLGGNVYRGSRGMAGEFGHIPIEYISLDDHNPDTVRCRCGRPGCIEGIVTPRGIDVELRRRDDEYDFPSALDHSDNPLVHDVFVRAGTELGRGIATLLNLLNPEAVIIYGPANLIGPARRFHLDNDSGSGLNSDRNVTDLYMHSMQRAVLRHAFSDAAGWCQFVIRDHHFDKEQVPVHGARAAAACIINILDQPTRGQAVTA